MPIGPVIDGWWLLITDSTNSQHVPCAVCNYDLFGATHGHCSECGTPVCASMDPRRLYFVGPSCLGWLLCALLIWISLAVFPFALLWLTKITGPSHVEAAYRKFGSILSVIISAIILHCSLKTRNNLLKALAISKAVMSIYLFVLLFRPYVSGIHYYVTLSLDVSIFHMILFLLSLHMPSKPMALALLSVALVYLTKLVLMVCTPLLMLTPKTMSIAEGLPRIISIVLVSLTAFRIYVMRRIAALYHQ